MHILDPHKVLGVRYGASGEEIKTAYRRAAKKHHPDVDKSGQATERFLEIRRAYEVLTNQQEDYSQHDAIRSPGRATRHERRYDPNCWNYPGHHKVKTAKEHRGISSPFFKAPEVMETFKHGNSKSRRFLRRAVWFGYLSVLSGAACGFVLQGYNSVNLGFTFEGWAATTIGLLLTSILLMVLTASKKTNFTHRY